MIDPNKFLDSFIKNGITFFCGVPDSLLKDLLSTLEVNKNINHIISANEGLAVSLSAGYAMASKEIPVVYFQNSGLGNIVNPLNSLTNSEVYSIPMIFIIGWRGQPGFFDEPQHMVQGRQTEEQISLLGVDVNYITADTNFDDLIEDIVKKTKRGRSQALLVSKNSFSNNDKSSNSHLHETSFTREEAINEIATFFSNDVLVSTTGKTSRELLKYRIKLKQPIRDFLTVGSMGHSSSIALGIALHEKNKRIICIDGDGAMLMHMGTIVSVGDISPKNFIHILINNNCHESVGRQRTPTANIDYKKLFLSIGYNSYYKAWDRMSLIEVFNKIDQNSQQGPIIVEVVVNSESDNKLPRPIQTPLENKLLFEAFLNTNEPDS